MTGPRVRPEQALLVLGLVALTVLTWPLLGALAAPTPPPLIALLAHTSGMLAGLGVLVLLVLVSRAPGLERGIGADVLARWHALGGRTVVALVLVHGAAATATWAQARGIGVLAASWEVLRMPWLPSAAVGTALLLTAAAASVRAARRRMPHETWHGVHLLMYGAIALSFGHQLAGPDLAGHRLLQIAWALAYTHVFALVLRHRVLAPLRQAARHRLRVAAVVPEGPSTVSIVVEGEHLDELGAEPGQFFRWRFLTPDHWATAHPFSLSAPPTPTTLRLTVKALGDGSRGLQHLPVGTWVLAEGPYGAVTPAARSHRNVLLVAGGVGITPMRALFEAMPLRDGEDLLLLYRASRSEDTLFAEELEAIAARRGARVLYGTGRGREHFTPATLLAVVPDVRDRDVFMCGPAGLMDAVRGSLQDLGVPPRQVHEERFAF